MRRIVRRAAASTDFLDPVRNEEDMGGLVRSSLAIVNFVLRGFRTAGQAFASDSTCLEFDDADVDADNSAHPERHANMSHIRSTLGIVTGAEDYSSLETLHPNGLV